MVVFHAILWWLYGILRRLYGIYPLVVTYIAIESDHLQWIFPSKTVDLPAAMLVIIRGYTLETINILVLIR